MPLAQLQDFKVVFSAFVWILLNKAINFGHLRCQPRLMNLLKQLSVTNFPASSGEHINCGAYMVGKIKSTHLPHKKSDTTVILYSCRIGPVRRETTL